MRTITLLLLALLTTNVFAQTLDEELGFIYVKAEYLMETNRYDEAIDEFTKIIAKDATYKDALYQRSLAKFNVGAFQGTYNDILKVFEIKGVDPASLLLFGKTQKNLGEAKVAAVTLATAGQLYPDGGSARDKQSDNPTNNDRSNNETNEEKSQADILKDKMRSILEDLLPDTADPATDDSTPTGDDNTGSEQTGDSGNRDRQTKGGTDRTSGNNDNGSNNGTVLKPVEENPEPQVDNSVNEIYVDEDVTLQIKNGLGARRVLEQPNILILSETSGTVVIDVCVNGNGKVTQAEFNTNESTLKTQSIISLAVRKSKEFWFKSSTADEMCGTIVYNITGSN